MNLIKAIVENDCKTPQAPFPSSYIYILPEPPLMLNDLLLAESGDRL